MILQFTVPGMVRGKARARSVVIGKNVRHYTPAQTVSYENAIKFAGAEAMAGRAPLTGPLQLWMTAYFAPPASASKAKREAMLENEIRPTVKPDVDNIMKCIDGLNGVVWVDDKQIVRAVVSKLYSETPRLEIEVRTLEPGQ